MTPISIALPKILRRFARISGACRKAFKSVPEYLELRAAPNQRFRIRMRDSWLCLKDATSYTGFDRHYIFHTAWAARIVAELKPTEHIDISSSLHFVVNTSAFVPVRFFDYRPAKLGLSGLTSEPGDLCNLPFPDNSVDSLSCMHVVEHVGLGRYGDPLDYNGDLKAVAELKRVTASGGSLLFVVPIGGEARIQFNAHRIYTYRQVRDMFTGFELREFALIPDREEDGGLIRHASEDISDKQRYGCGCFWFVKK
jgi:SAM-dependent methyltransferase